VVILAIFVAGVAAAVFAVATSLQHHAAGSAGQAGGSTKRWLMQLAGRPSWLIGIGLSAVGFGLHAAALALGSVALVQPIVISATVFAVLVRAGLDGRLPAWAELGWATCTWAGLALFLSVTTFRSGQPRADGDVAGILRPGRAAIEVPRATRCVVGCRGRCVVRACRRLDQDRHCAVRLSVSMPVLNLIDVLVALLFATTVFGERLFSTPATVTVQLVALAAIGARIWRLARRQEYPSNPKRVNPHLCLRGRSSVPS
jgi:hypothetical protein